MLLQIYRYFGKNFNKYGTNFGIQMMVIDNNGATKNTITDYVEDLHDLQSILGGIRNERPILDYSANEQRATTTTRKEIATTRTKGSVGGGTVSDTSSGIDTEQSSNKGRVPKAQRCGDKKFYEMMEVVETLLIKEPISQMNWMMNDDLTDEENQEEMMNCKTLEELISLIAWNIVFNLDMAETKKNGGLRQNGVGVQRLKKKELTDNVFEEYKVAPLKVKKRKATPCKIKRKCGDECSKST